MRWTRNEVRPGMTVSSPNGERLGNVVRVGSDTFVVEKGVFFPKDYELRYDHIVSLGGKRLGSSLSKPAPRSAGPGEDARAGTAARPAAPPAATPMGIGPGASAAPMAQPRKTAPPSVG